MSKSKKMRGFLVSDLLIGQMYKSPNNPSRFGEIVTAVKSDYSENAYLISYWDINDYRHATIEVVL